MRKTLLERIIEDVAAKEVSENAITKYDYDKWWEGEQLIKHLKHRFDLDDIGLEKGSRYYVTKAASLDTIRIHEDTDHPAIWTKEYGWFTCEWE